MKTDCSAFGESASHKFTSALPRDAGTEGLKHVVAAPNKKQPVGSMCSCVNLPLLDVPLSCAIMRTSIAVPHASFFQTASG